MTLGESPPLGPSKKRVALEELHFLAYLLNLQ